MLEPEPEVHDRPGAQAERQTSLDSGVDPETGAAACPTGVCSVREPGL